TVRVDGGGGEQVRRPAERRFELAVGGVDGGDDVGDQPGQRGQRGHRVPAAREFRSLHQPSVPASNLAGLAAFGHCAGERGFGAERSWWWSKGPLLSP